MTGIKPDSPGVNLRDQRRCLVQAVLGFDNGRFTYFNRPQDMQELPALFGMIVRNAYSLVNLASGLSTRRPPVSMTWDNHVPIPFGGGEVGTPDFVSGEIHAMDLRSAFPQQETTMISRRLQIE